MRRDRIVQEVCTDLVMGRCCFVVGPAFTAKTPLVRHIAHRIASETSYKVQYINFRHVRGDTWEETLGKILGFLYEDLNQPVETSFRDGLQNFLDLNPDIKGLVMMFDDLEHLPTEQLPELASQCHAIYTEGRVDPVLRKISMLWAADKSLLQKTLGLMDAFIRNTFQYRVGCLSQDEFDEILQAKGHDVPLSAELRQRLWRLTEGHPDLSWVHGNCFVSRAIYKLQSSSEVLNHIEALDNEADLYVSECINQLQSPEVPLKPSLFSSIASRIENSVVLLDIISDITCAHNTKPSAANIESAVQSNSDFLVMDSGKPRIRGLILDKFIRSYFDCKRIGDCYFTHYDYENTWTRTIACYKKVKPSELRRRDTRFTTPTGKSLQNLAEIASYRFHLLEKKDDILKTLCQIIHYVVGIPYCYLLELTNDNVSVKFSVPGMALSYAEKVLSGHQLYVIEAAIKTGQASQQSNNRQICIPIYLEGKTRYLFWADTREQSPLISTEISLLTTLCRFAEGPLATVEAKERNQQQMAARDREIALFRRLSRPTFIQDDYLMPVLDKARQSLEAMGYKVQIACKDVLTGITLSSPSHQEDSQSSSGGKTYIDQNYQFSIAIPSSIDGTNIGQINVIKASAAYENADFLEVFAQFLGSHIEDSWAATRGKIYSFVFDHVGTGIQVIDEEHNVLALNQDLESLLRERDGFEGQWIGRKCYNIYRPEGQNDRPCDNCTTQKAKENKTSITQIETWASPKFPNEKQLWHKVTSIPIFEGGRIIANVERSRPLDVHDVFAELGKKIFGERNADIIRDEITRGVLMLGFDGARLYWLDPDTGLPTQKTMVVGKYENLQKPENPIVIKQNSPNFEVFENIQKGKVSLIRRESLENKGKLPLFESTVDVFYADPFPYEKELKHEASNEIVIVPLFSSSGYMGAIAADYKISGQFVTQDDIRKLRQYAWLAAQFIQGAEYPEHLTDLLRRLSHQTLTPMQAILFHLEVMRSGSPEVREESYEAVSQTIKRLANTFSIHSSFVKAASLSEYDTNLKDEVLEKLNAVKVRELFLDQESLFRAFCKEEKIDFRVGETRSGRKELEVNIHRDIFSEALTNLVQNAVQAVTQSSRKIIELKAYRRRGIQILVSDTGIGIHPGLWKRVFEPFYPPRSRGSGIGLYITKKNLEAHGFTIEIVNPTLGCGTTFRITVPEGDENAENTGGGR